MHRRVVLAPELCLVSLLLSVTLACSDAQKDELIYAQAPVTRGPISSAVSSTGSLKAVVTVDVGTQVSGLIQTLEADFNTPVEEGQIIARIDPRPFSAVLEQAKAELAIAQANVAIQNAALQEIEADIAGSTAAMIEANADVERKQSLAKTNSIPSSTVDTAVALALQAEARVKADEARLLRQEAQTQLAQARILQASALLEQRQLDLDYTLVRSPVDGTVIIRNVDAGQTVAASLQAPVLFRIAGDLTEMELNISVDEADIGRVREGQEVYFTVDAYVGRTFKAKVHQIRLVGQQISNVVTYAVVAKAANPDGSLLPGMTANVSIVAESREDALRVPTSAIRLALPGGAVPQNGSDWVWLIDEGGDVRQIAIEPGVSDGTYSEVLSGELTVAERVITGFIHTATN